MDSTPPPTTRNLLSSIGEAQQVILDKDASRLTLSSDTKVLIRFLPNVSPDYSKWEVKGQHISVSCGIDNFRDFKEAPAPSGFERVFINDPDKGAS